MPSDSIRYVLCDRIIESTDTLNGTVKLKETNPGSRLNEIVIHKLPEDAIVFKLDMQGRDFRTKSNYLSTERDIHKSCDYVIVCPTTNRGEVLFVELKSNVIKGAKKQLICTVPFWEYLVSLIKIHRKVNIANFKKHFILFTKNRNFNKPRTTNSLPKIDYEGYIIKIAGAPSMISITKLIDR